MAACSEARLGPLVRLAALLWISLLAAGAHALIPVGTPAYLNGSVGDLTVQRGLAYAVGRDGLEILDASSPERGYTTLGTLPGAYDHIEVRGDVAYLTSNFGLHIVDVSDPVSPIEVGFLPEAGVRESYALDVAGRFVLLARGAPTSRVGLRIVDVGDPAAPVARGELSGMELPISTFPLNSELSVVHEGHYAFVVHSIGGVAVVDIANPDAPTLVTTFAFSGTGSVGGVALQRGSLFLPGENASEESELLIYDVTDPAAPAPRAPIENLFCARLAVARGIAYCAQSFPYPFGGIALRLFDVSDPASPTGLGLLLLDGFVNALAIADGFAHVVAISAGSVGPRSLQAVDVRVPELPAHALTQEAPYAALALEGTRLYGVGLDRFDVLDVAVPLAPSLLGSVSLRALQFGDVEIFGGTAYVTTSAGIAVLDVSDAAHPRIVTTLTRPVAELASEFARAGNTLYVATFGGRIDIYDIGTTPAAPRLLGSLALADRSAPHDHDLEGERLYVTSVRGLSILDVADATSPREIGRIESPSPAPYPGFGQAGISRDVLYLNEQP
ncbi:MAG TPA: hypothetical protein VFY49_03705, partial [Myxococcota bacterium]|nr:hypothetical protein [Myxococcota bacterium]